MRSGDMKDGIIQGRRRSYIRKRRFEHVFIAGRPPGPCPYTALTPRPPSDPSAPADLSPRLFAWAIAAILALTAVVHARAFGNPFLFFDDPQNVLDNPPIRALTPEHLRTFFTTPLLGMYSPLVYLSFALDYAIGGFDTTAYHATNLALHLLDVCLVAVIVRRLTNHATGAALVALLFGVHPVNVAGVAPISVRSSLLYSAFYLAAYLAYLVYARRAQRRWLAITLICFILSGLSKSSAVVFPAILVLTDWYLGRRLTPRVWIEKLPFLLIAMVFAALTLAFRSDVGVVQDFSPVERVTLALYSLASYAFALVVPIGLSPFHPYPQRVNGQLPLTVYIGAAATIAFVVSAWLWRSQRRLLAFGGLFFFINVVLVLKLVPLGVEFMADRYVYLPSIGLLLVIVELGRAPGPTARRVALAAFAGLAVWFSTLAYSRTADWRDRLTFETRVLQRYPDDPDALAGLGVALARAGRLDEAVASFSRAAAIDPNNADTRVNLCAALQRLGRFDEAVREGRAAVRLRPQQADAHTNLAAALEALGRSEESASEYAEAVRLTPASAEAHANLGRALLAVKGRSADAVTHLREALRLGAPPGPTHYLLGNALAELDRLPDAVAEYRSALADERMARSPELHNDFGVALVRFGQVDAAIAQFREALRLDPTFEAAAANLARAGGR
jgi:Flp pilus assembly protein TadD